MRRVLTHGFAVAAMLCWAAAGSSATSGTVIQDSRVVGYYPSWVADDYPPEKVEFKNFTHVCHAFLPVDKNGQPHGEGTVPSRTLTGRAHAAGVKVLLSFGGANSGPRYNAFTASSEKRKRFIEGALRLVEEFEYDGLDNDWEFPENAKDRERYATLHTELRAALDRLERKVNRQLLLTAALPNGNWYGQWYPADVLAEHSEFLNIMTYDFAGPWRDLAAHNAPLMKSSRDPDGGAVVGTMGYWVARGIPKAQLHVGLANYGRGFDVAEPYLPVARGSKASAVAELDYRGAVKLLEAGWTRKWDLETEVPWLYSPNGNSVFGYDDPESLTKKVKWGRAEGYGGIFFWDMHGDLMPDGSHPLVDAAVKALRE